MNDLICPFGVTLVQHDFSCKFADEVVRRGGAEIACQDAGQHTLCCDLHNRLKSAALEAMGLEDDLLTLPHSVLIRIQYGGLYGLAQCVTARSDNYEKVEDIAALVNAGREQYSGFDSLPYAQISEVIAQYKLSRRGGRK